MFALRKSDDDARKKTMYLYSNYKTFQVYVIITAGGVESDKKQSTTLSWKENQRISLFFCGQIFAMGISNQKMFVSTIRWGNSQVCTQWGGRNRRKTLLIILGEKNVFTTFFPKFLIQTFGKSNGWIAPSLSDYKLLVKLTYIITKEQIYRIFGSL